MQRGVAEIERVIGTGNFSKAAELAEAQSSKYPNDFNLQALKLKVDDLLRQEKSAYIAEIARRVESEPDLDRAVHLLDEAIEKYPKEAHFPELASSIRKRRDLVNSIAAKARQYEEQNLAPEALAQWNTLRSIHPRYPGLDFEIEQIRRRIEENRREEAKLNWVDQIDRLLQAGDHDRAMDLASKALSDFAEDPELLSLERLALEGRARRSQAITLMERAEALCSGENFEAAIDLLNRATELDSNNQQIRSVLANALVSRARIVLATDWRAAEKLVQEALDIDPAHALAKSLRPSVLLAERKEFVDNCLAGARQLQAAGDLHGALAKVQEGLGTYPNDARLAQLQNTLRSNIVEQQQLRRNKDLEELRRLSRDVEKIGNETSLTALLERSDVLTQRYPEDAEFKVMHSRIKTRATSDFRQKSAPQEQPPVHDAAPVVPPRAIEPRRPSLVDQVRAKVADAARGSKSSETWNSMRRALTRLRTKGVPLLNTNAWHKGFASVTTRYRSSRLGKLPKVQQVGLAIGCLVVVVLAVFGLRPSQPPTPRDHESACDYDRDHRNQC